LIQAESDFPGRLVYALFYLDTAPYPMRDSYYAFDPCPGPVVDGIKVSYTKITTGTIFPPAINRQSGVDLTASLAGGTLSGSVQNTSGGELTALHVRVFKVNNDDPLYKPNLVVAIVAEDALVTPLADGDSDTFNVTGITLAGTEKLVVFIQSDTNKEVFHAVYAQ